MKIESWGRYPKLPQKGLFPDWQQQIAAMLNAASDGRFLPFGNGRSYGDVCLAESGQVLVSRGLDRFIKLDREQGFVRVEAGLTLGEILAVIVPLGWFLPVVPGTRLATVGGAIGNDVHGKNHHVRGTFGCHVRRLWLWREGQLLECSPAVNNELFRATIGGLGLTGIIVEAELALMPVQNGQIDTVTHRFDRLEEFFSLAQQYDVSYEYGVAWIDCVSRGSQRGRGVYFAGNHARYRSEIDIQQRQLNFPLTPPVSLVNSLSLKAFNEFYWHTKPAHPKAGRASYLSYFFPLDGILHWNRMYGRAGFQQYQCVIPLANSEAAMAEMLESISASGSGSFLAVLKQCGEVESPGLLSFPLHGTSLALDFPNGRKLGRLFQRLDDITRAADGRLYPAKDAHMTAADFQQAYPQWQQLEALRDPAICSHFWRRVSA
ncbi:FAD-binding oxidoreductase [Oceanobacter mangrovi]|uniref:FAD-binding oxidoreductase n=1 Tax=Oceanobacter mangrovi TaxID=2862510 RepID=UPI002484D4C0|nr:FAD-binding oxidoreductase [Oceanobacter mangrovi]